MFANQRLVRSLVNKIRQVERETLDALRDGRVEQEPAFTDRLLGAHRAVGGVQEGFHSSKGVASP